MRLTQGKSKACLFWYIPYKLVGVGCQCGGTPGLALHTSLVPAGDWGLAIGLVHD